MIRAFDWRDVGLVKTLAERGVCLDAETGLTQGTHPLQQALLSYLMPMAGPPPTYIWRAGADKRGYAPPAGADRLAAADKPAAAGDNHHPVVFGQIRHRLGEEHARLLYMAPVPASDGDGWLPVIERLAAEAGERRAQNLLAEVNERSPEFDALREAGFAIYARQSLWRLPPGPAPAARVEPAPLRAARRADAIGVATLYSNIVPRLVQQVEPGPQQSERGYVLAEGGELLAYLDVRRGPQGIWVEPFLHPEAYDRSEAVMAACLQLVPNRKEKPLYVCVRRYQDWLQEVVARVGFEAIGAQAVMVKRMAVRVIEPVLKPLPVVEGHAATPITSVRLRVYEEERPPAQRSNGKQIYRWHTHAKTHNR
jgi:hypothetical protein